MLGAIETLDRSLKIATVGYLFGQFEAVLSIRHLSPLKIRERASLANDLNPMLVNARLIMLVGAGVFFLLGSTLAYLSLFLVSLSFFWVQIWGELNTNDTADYTINVYVLFGSLTRMLSSDGEAEAVVLVAGAFAWLFIYFISGTWKFSKPWLRGDALIRVLATESFGYPSLARRLRGGWFVAIAQRMIPFLLVGIPFAILLGDNRLAMVAIAAAGLFHVSNAFIMGLTSFLYAYLAFLPAIWCLHLLARQFLRTF